MEIRFAHGAEALSGTLEHDIFCLSRMDDSAMKYTKVKGLLSIAFSSAESITGASKNINKNQMDSELFNSLENAPNFKSVWDN